VSGFFIKRSLQSLIALFGTVTLIFFVQRLAGDPTLLLAPEGATAADIERLQQSLGLDRPVQIQYLDYLRSLAQFDFGRSLAQQVPVSEIILSRLPYTLALAGGALLVALSLGLPIGALIALRAKSGLARLLTGVVLAGQSMPTFWSGILLILLFAVTLGWLPPSGAESPESIILPAISLGLLSMATFARVSRNAILNELGKDYVRTARSKGLTTVLIFRRHLLRNSAIPIVTIGALELANMLAGAVIVETVFAWPGLGQVVVQAINARDFPVVQAVVLLGGAVAIALNLIADLLYSVIDPRIRLQGAAS